jgi:hypothetical protein
MSWCMARSAPFVSSMLTLLASRESGMDSDAPQMASHNTTPQKSVKALSFDKAVSPLIDGLDPRTLLFTILTSRSILNHGDDRL